MTKQAVKWTFGQAPPGLSFIDSARGQKLMPIHQLTISHWHWQNDDHKAESQVENGRQIYDNTSVSTNIMTLELKREPYLFEAYIIASVARAANWMELLFAKCNANKCRMGQRVAHASMYTELLMLFRTREILWWVERNLTAAKIKLWYPWKNSWLSLLSTGELWIKISVSFRWWTAMLWPNHRGAEEQRL